MVDVITNHDTPHPIDAKRVEDCVRDLLVALGEDPGREGLHRTPARVAAFYQEVLAGHDDDPASHLDVTFEAGHREMVMVRDIPFSSLCEHHLVPFIGKAHVAYIPGADGRITGLSKLARLVDGFAHRLQVQERLTTQVAGEWSLWVWVTRMWLTRSPGSRAATMASTWASSSGPGSITATSPRPTM